MKFLFEDMDSLGAEFSPDKICRYTLRRRWDDGAGICWLCFNPSTADVLIDDPSVRKMVGFSKRWGYGRLIVLNLYAIRSTDPRTVKRMGESAVGPLNDYWILQSLSEARELVCAWGCAQHAPSIDGRIAHVIGMIREKYPDLPMRCLGYRKDGHPRHPLMVPYEMKAVDFEVRYG